MANIKYIASTDMGVSMQNMLTYFIEEFQRMDLTLNSSFKIKDIKNFAFLNSEYADLIGLLTFIFEYNKALKIKFVNLLKKDENKQFLTKFWFHYRDTLFFSAFNTFHNPIWQHIAQLFMLYSKFLTVLCKSESSLDQLTQKSAILDIFHTFKVKQIDDEEEQDQNNTLYFQLYVILECLGNYNRLLTIKNQIQIQHRHNTFFVIVQLLRILSHVLKHPKSQQSIYVYRVDIWMNILIRYIEDLDSEFYDVKYELVNYFLSMSSNNDVKIIKFYGANLNIKNFKDSINNLFKILLRKFMLSEKVIENPLLVHLQLKNNKIYKLLQKMYRFYLILVRNNVQINYLHMFIEQQLKKMPYDIEY